MDFEKYTQMVTVEVKPQLKDVYEESWEQGEGEYLYSTQSHCESLTLYAVANETGIEYIRKEILKYLNDNFCHKIEESALSIINNNVIHLGVIESEYGIDITRFYSKDWEERVLSCHYDFGLCINGLEPTQEEMLEIFPGANY